jgi:myo-inositol-1(or 4)-monophosphatase
MKGGPDWRRILTDASRDVQTAVSKVASSGEAAKAIEVGASGDTTLLADKEAEGRLFRALNRIESLRIISEEAGNRGDPNGRLVAVVDPLDGSSNFERGIPFYCTSVAVATGDSLGDVSWGLIRNLVNGDVYWARRGHGSFKNGSRLRASKTSALRSAVLDIDISRTSAGLVTRLAPLIASVARQVHFGANALELCLLAEGKVDAFVDVRGRMRMTDFAAGFLIAKEAGAVIAGKDVSLPDLPLRLDTKISFVASGTRQLQLKVLELCP